MTPCGWPLLFPTGETTLDGLGVSDRAAVEAAATDYLWRWSGQVFGVCRYLLRPCRAPAGGDRRPAWFPLIGTGGRQYPVGCGACGHNGCRCGDSVRTLRLPWPTQAVTRVTIDGADIPPSSYRFEGGSLLTRLDGAWPAWQDLTREPGTPGTWEVEFDHGVPVPDGGQIAAGVLAVELGKSLAGDKSCQLPTRVQTITRQGVTVAVLDAMEDIEKGRTGIWAVDSWLASVTAPPRRPSVRSPDVALARIRRSP